MYRVCSTPTATPRLVSRNQRPLPPNKHRHRLGMLGFIALSLIASGVLTAAFVLKANPITFLQPTTPAAHSASFVYSTMAGGQSTLWLGSTSDLSKATALVTVPHKEGFGLK